jgi:hypothetical protein
MCLPRFASDFEVYNFTDTLTSERLYASKAPQ